MCGIAGLLPRSPISPATLADAARRMADALLPRGPDDGGSWSDAQGRVGLGHRRLSIVDLSPLGHQPMASACGRYVLVFNGEIYNHPELRRELEQAGLAPNWRGHSDTEVLLAALAAWGMAATLPRLTGMFALALWDAATAQVHLARDRFGEKPLVYARTPRGWLFASTLAALRVDAAFDHTLDHNVLALYLRHNYVPAPYTPFRQAWKLPPGAWLTLDAAATTVTPQIWWSARDSAMQAIADPFTGSLADATQAVDLALRQSLAGQMVADVPLGAFLSGGIDSSTVVGVMQALSNRPVRTFTIGFQDGAYNEADHARAVARHLGTDHTELIVTGEQAMAVIPRLAGAFDEPFADSSQIPTLLVAELARQQVTVSLSGDGGDELFGGYNRYTWATRLWRRLSPLPQPLRRLLRQSVTALPPRFWDSLAAPIPHLRRYAPVGDKLHKAAGLADAASADDLYRRLVSLWQKPTLLLPGSHEPPSALDQPPDLPLLERMMLLDTVSYLPDDILAKVDRAAMAVSLETRVPLLDHRLFELAWRLPNAYKLHGGIGKRVLREVLYRYVPPALVERPKMGFGVPLGDWLRGPLRPWAEDLLTTAALQRDDLFDPQPVRALWQAHLSGRRNGGYALWAVLMLQCWRDRNA